MYKLLILLTVLLQTSIYSIHFNDSNGTDHSFSGFSGKRILIVNIASGSPRVSQLAGLQQLYAQYHDSLEIVAFPSNTFNNEPLDNAAIRALCENTYHTGFTIAAKGTVAGSQPQAIYSWIADSTQNGLTHWPAIGDFHKFLIDKDGSLIASFAPGIQPTDPLIINAITGN